MDTDDRVFKLYVTESLRLMPQGKFIDASVGELVELATTRERSMDPTYIVERLVSEGAFEVV